MEVMLDTLVAEVVVTVATAVMAEIQTILLLIPPAVEAEREDFLPMVELADITPTAEMVITVKVAGALAAAVGVVPRELLLSQGVALGLLVL